MKEVFRVEILRKDSTDDLYSRPTAIFLTVAALSFSKLVPNFLILDYLNCF